MPPLASWDQSLGLGNKGSVTARSKRHSHVRLTMPNTTKKVQRQKAAPFSDYLYHQAQASIRRLVLGVCSSAPLLITTKQFRLSLCHFLKRRVTISSA